MTAPVSGGTNYLGSLRMSRCTHLQTQISFHINPSHQLNQEFLIKAAKRKQQQQQQDLS